MKQNLTDRKHMKCIHLKAVLASIFAIVFVTVLPHTGFVSFFPFAYTIPIVAFVWLYLKAYKDTFADIGFNLKSFGFKPLLIGGLVAVLSLLFLRFIFFPILENIIEFQPTDVELYTRIRGHTGFYIFILIMNPIVGGLYEEIVFHGFIFTRLEKLLHGKYQTLISFLITSVIFGLYHYQLGTADVINAFMMGAAYLVLFLFYKRNLWYSIGCHAIYNTIVITFLYLGYL